jgi:hypothetical protein
MFSEAEKREIQKRIDDANSFNSPNTVRCQVKLELWILKSSESLIFLF